MIIVIARVVIHPANLAEALALSQAHVARSRAEPGCLAHAVHQDSEDANRLVFVEEWSDQAALKAHFRVPASRTFATALGALASQPPKMTIYSAEPVMDRR